MIVKFTVPGEPVGKGRPRFTRSGHTYTPDKTRDYEEAVRWSYRSASQQCIESEAVGVLIYAYYKIPKSASKADREKMLKGDIRPKKKPDIDNISKAVLDALNGLAYKDGAQIVYLCVTKSYSDEPRVDVTLNEVNG